MRDHRDRPWMPSEIERLRALAHLSPTEAGKLLGRTGEAIARKRRHLRRGEGDPGRVRAPNERGTRVQPLPATAGTLPPLISEGGEP